jgi:pyruvate dehydrogenase E1 component
MDDLGDQGDVTALIDARSDSELAALMENLGGNCVSTMAEPSPRSTTTGRPVSRLHDQGLGHADRGPQGQPRRADEQGPDGRVAGRWACPKARNGSRWQPCGQGALQAFLDEVAVLRQGPAALPRMRRCPCRRSSCRPDREISTQMAFGKILDDLSKDDSALAARIVTTSPDVTGTTNLGPWVNRRKLFAREEIADTFRDAASPPPRNGSSHPTASISSSASRR